MRSRFTTLGAVALATLLATAACNRMGGTDDATDQTPVAGQSTGESTPATAGMDQASPGTASHPGATPPPAATPPDAGDRADSDTGATEPGAPDR